MRRLAGEQEGREAVSKGEGSPLQLVLPREDLEPGMAA